MSVSLSWAVKIGGVASPVDFTSRCVGLSISQPLELMRTSTHTATIELLNNDGELTPAGGGGTGTYASTDWFAQGLFISCAATGTGSTTAEVFHGLISDFDLRDDGITSSVVITAVDVLSIASRSQTNVNFSDVGTASFDLNFRLLVDRVDLLTPNPLPLLGASSSALASQLVSQFVSQLVAGFQTTPSDMDSQRVGDALATQFMPSAISAAWASRIISDPPDCEYHVLLIGPALNRDTKTGTYAYATVRNFTLVESGGGTDEIPFRDLDVGFNSEHLINFASIDNVDGTQAASVANATSIEKYGTQAFEATKTALTSTTSPQNVPDDLGKQTAASLTNRFGTIEFVPRSLVLTSGNLASADASASDDVAYLLDAAGIFQTATIEWTPTGAASQTSAECVIMGRSIQATPQETVVTLELRPASTLTSFVLDSTKLGVLDSDRIV